MTSKVMEEGEQEAPAADPRFRVVSVGRRGLGLLRSLVERFCDTGVSEWTADTLMETAWERLGTPIFRVWAVVREGEIEPVGFLVGQVQVTPSGTDLYLLVAYMEPGLPLKAGWPMLDSALRWGRIMGCERAMVRTVRGTSNGLSEPRAWERLGFVYESTLLVGPMAPRLEEEEVTEEER